MVLFFDGRLHFRASSLSTWLAIAFLSFTYPKALATSIPTNQGFPSIVTVLTFPNSGLLKIIISFIRCTRLSWYCLIFSMAEKQLRLTACRVAITIPAMLRRAFLFFRVVLVVTTADWGFIYTPSRSSSTDAGKSAHRPMGTAVLAWSLSIGCLRQ